MFHMHVIHPHVSPVFQLIHWNPASSMLLQSLLFLFLQPPNQLCPYRLLPLLHSVPLLGAPLRQLSPKAPPSPSIKPSHHMFLLMESLVPNFLTYSLIFNFYSNIFPLSREPIRFLKLTFGSQHVKIFFDRPSIIWVVAHPFHVMFFCSEHDQPSFCYSLREVPTQFCFLE